MSKGNSGRFLHMWASHMNLCRVEVCRSGFPVKDTREHLLLADRWSGALHFHSSSLCGMETRFLKCFTKVKGGTVQCSTYEIWSAETRFWHTGTSDFSTLVENIFKIPFTYQYTLNPKREILWAFFQHSEQFCPFSKHIDGNTLIQIEVWVTLGLDLISVVFFFYLRVK